MLDFVRFVSVPRLRALLLATLPAALLVLAAPAHAQVWTEAGDAGDLVGTAQATAGTGSLNTILGNLASPTDVDVYCIHLAAVPPANLPLVQLQCVVIGGPNVRLFDAAGNGVYMNETCQAGAKTLLAPNVSMPAGTYYVAVSYYGVDPQSAGGPIWLTGLPGQRAPDGPGAAGTLTGWSGTPLVQPINPYQLNLMFMQYCSAPTPTLHPTWGTLKSHYR
jgi:hypothetical protein